MKVVTLLFVPLILLFVSAQEEEVKGKRYENLLFETIFKGYNKKIRPVEDYHLAVVVNFSISIQQILQVDEKHQVITTNLWRSLFWKDGFLKWKPENYGNISQITLVRSDLWTPDIQLYNSALSDKNIASINKVVVNSDGAVADVLPMLVKSTCRIDVTWFPFDEQKCSLVFGSWCSSSKYLLLQRSENADESTNDFVGNGEWVLVGVTSARSSKIYPCCPDESYHKVTYTIHLKRRTFYYFFNLLVPCGLIGFLAILGFTLPPESGEKLPLGATILFSLIVFLNMIGESMPANSDAVPLLGTYFNCVMFTIALSVVSTIVVNLNLNAVTPKEVQGLSKRLFLVWLPWILRIKPPPNIVVQQNEMSLTKNKIGNAFTLDSNRSLHTDSLAAFGVSSKIVVQQWKFISAVVDRMCLMLSIIFSFVSVTVFLIYAFQ